ncbi:hypothetical protein SRHO_G00191760 [Serrasalmus rhombeus]
MSACQRSHIEAYLSSAALDQGWRSDSQPSVVLVNDLIPDPFRLTDPKLCVFMWNVTDTTPHGQGLDAAAPHYSSSKEDDSGPETPAGPH